MKSENGTMIVTKSGGRTENAFCDIIFDAMLDTGQFTHTN